MAIKDIFKMIKADRYTQDGREELIKAQEAVTEDVTYKPGDISRKTGLQKQPDGSWAPVKNAPAQSKKSDKTTPEEMSKIKTLSAQYKNAKTDAEKDRIANEVNKIMGVEEKMKAEQSAPGWRAPGSESDPNTEGSIAWYAQQAKKSPSASGSLREQTPAIREKEESITANEADKFYEGFGLKKTGEHVDSKGWTVKEYKNDSGETWTGKFNKEGKYVGSEYVPSSGSAPSAPKFETEQENAKYEEGLKGWDDVNPDRLPDIKKKVEQKIDYYKKYDPYAMLGKKTGLTAAQKSAVQQNMAQAKENLAFYTGQLEGINKKMGGGSAPSDLKIQGMSKEEYIPWRMKAYKENEAQASSMWNHFAEQQKNKGKENEYDPDFHPLRDSAPRILTGDCKVRIKKSK